MCERERERERESTCLYFSSVLPLSSSVCLCSRKPVCLILEPSRELAEQTHQAIASFRKYGRQREKREREREHEERTKESGLFSRHSLRPKPVGTRRER